MNARTQSNQPITWKDEKPCNKLVRRLSKGLENTRRALGNQPAEGKDDGLQIRLVLLFLLEGKSSLGFGNA